MEFLGACCLLGVGVLLFLVWTAIMFAVGPKHFYLLWLGLPALALIILICLALALSFYQSLPGVVFRDIAGFDATSDIEFVHSLRHEPTKWDNSYLVLYASDSTINRILANGFTAIGPTDFDEYGDTPEWWNPPTGPGVRVYATNTHDPDFRGKTWRYFVSYRLLIYDPGSGDSGRRKVYLRYRR
jgi:hypothetical protein